MKGLIIKEKWADLILNGEKTIEVRGSDTKIRGEIAVIKSGTQRIYGVVSLTETVKLSENAFEENREHTKLDIGYRELTDRYAKPYGWVLSNPVKLDKPVPYEHKRGCVIWINLPDNILEGEY